jgi:Pvc16 N-terminal domain
VLYDVGESIREMLVGRCEIPPDIDVVFDAPTRDWASRRSGPVIDVFLYDIRENLERRQNLLETVREDDLAIGRVPPTRWFTCSYMVTAWTQRPEDEHRLLGSILEGLLTTHAVPHVFLQGRLRDRTHEVFLTLARPLGQDRSISDLWSSLGGELKPSIDLVLVVPFEPNTLDAVGPPVLEAPSLSINGSKAPAPKDRRTAGHRRAKDPVAAAGQVETRADVGSVAVVSEEAVGGTETQPGRRFRFAVHEPGSLPK